MRVAEGHLAPHDGLVRGDRVLAVGEIGEVNELVLAPLLIGMLRSERCLDLFVIDNAAERCVDEEYLARLEPPLLHDARGVDVHDAGLARHDHAVVVGHPVAARSQAVAVEHGADHGAVGKRDRSRAVPRLHQGRVISVKRALLGRHRRVVLPGLGDHHEDAVRERAAAEVQELEALVEAHRVRRSLGDDREGALELRIDTGAQAATMGTCWSRTCCGRARAPTPCADR